jgi:hypothetical protein
VRRDVGAIATALAEESALASAKTFVVFEPTTEEGQKRWMSTPQR